jgi:hypothetical protein
MGFPPEKPLVPPPGDQCVQEYSDTNEKVTNLEQGPPLL